MSRRLSYLVAAGLHLALIAPVAAQTPPAVPSAVEPAPVAPAIEQVTFDEAVQRAVAHNPTVGQAAQAILRAEALLDSARSVFRPSVSGAVATTVLDAARGFSGNITQPRTQTAFGATLSYPVLAASRWAAKTQAQDQVGVARISAEETRREVALAAAEAYLAVLSAHRLLDVSLRDREAAQALGEYARLRLEAGQGSRLNFVRSSQEVAADEGRVQAAELALRQGQEALGVAMFADLPIDTSGVPALAAAEPPASHDAWLLERPDVRLFTAQVSAADRVVRDTWKSWLPEVTAGFTPQYVTPPGFFAPAATWAALFQLQVPIYDGTIGATRRLRVADREIAQLRLDALKVQARSELRFAQEAVVRNERIVTANRQAAADAAEALRISEIAYKAGATTNVEVVQAQQTASNAAIAAAQAEDRLLQARLDLLLALGQFPR
ncbi:MAG TPA: TolC family protein [Vicinamibacteria bacterium]|nr:TolC family protein [Vicinamibacteria bacterium]